ncbi:MAG: TolC family protein [Treponema sp.]|nr:TolC family protein [Treponema sp.]
MKSEKLIVKSWDQSCCTKNNIASGLSPGSPNSEPRSPIPDPRSLIRFVLCSLFSVLCSLFSIHLSADTMRLTPDEAVERAINSNLGLESERVGLATRRRASNLSWNQFIPSITVGGSMIIDNERSTVRIVEFDPTHGLVPLVIDNPRWNLAVPVQASLTLTMAMFENMNRLQLDYESGLIAYDKAKLQLERDVRKAYNSMLMLQENIALLNESFEAAERRVQMVQANYRAGLAPELSLLQAQVARENMRPVMDQAETGLRLSMANFAMFLGLPYDTPFELLPPEHTTEFIPLDVRELISQAASGKPDIQELRHNILMLQSVRKVQVYSLLPYLNLNWGITPMYLSDPLNEWRRSGALTITLGVRLHSLLPFSTDFQGIRNIDDQITTANIGLARMIQGTEIEIYNTVLSLDRTRVTAEAQAQTVNLAERSLQLTEQAYRAGLQDFLQVQNAELELRQARVQMLEQQFNYLNGLLDLEYSIGVPFGTLSKKEN